MGRKPCCSKEEGLNRGSWTVNEDKILIDYIKLHGEGKWRQVPKAAGLNRCGKSCRLRWLNYLRPDIKRGNITRDEEDLIIRLHKLLGNRWSLIAGRLPGRTDNEIKNYWNTVLSKRVPQQVNALDPTCEDEMKFKKQRIISGAIVNVIHAKAERCTKVFISPQQQAIRKDDNYIIAAPSMDAKTLVRDETAVQCESNDGSFTLPSTSKENNNNNASSKFRMDFDSGEISRVSEGLASDVIMQLCDFDFSDVNTLICEYGNNIETTKKNCGQELLARPEGMVEKYWSSNGNDCGELEANYDSLDSDFGFLAAFLNPNEDYLI